MQAMRIMRATLHLSNSFHCSDSLTAGACRRFQFAKPLLMLMPSTRPEGADARHLVAVTVDHRAAAAISPVNIYGVETKDLHLYYYDNLSFLEPHTVRTFTNSLAWQRRVFGWLPSEPTTVQLKDFNDYGNAHAYVQPHDKLEFDVAPLSHTFETFPASERMYSLMNHELIHEVQGDIANPGSALAAILSR
jgi:hypothetical protein